MRREGSAARDVFFDVFESAIDDELARISEDFPSSWVRPVPFLRDVLDLEPWRLQSDVCEALERPGARVAIAGCHNSGKTLLAAGLVAWWVVGVGGKAITTAPSDRQVRRTMWDQYLSPYIARVRSRIREETGRLLPEPNLQDWTVGPDRYALGMSTDAAARFQGWKGRVLLVIDEAQGMSAELLKAIKSFAGGDIRILAIGNPLSVGGPFYQMFEGTSGVEWETFTVDAFRTPNIEPILDGANPDEIADEELRAIVRELDSAEVEVETIPGLISRKYLRSMVDDEEWGPRVRGRFPTEGTSALVPLAWSEAAGRREPEDVDLPVEVGIDVAGPGEDATVVYVQRGYNVLAKDSWTDSDPRGDVVGFLHDFEDRTGLAIGPVKVDVAWGYYFAKHLRDEGFDVVEVNVGWSPVADTPEEERKVRREFANLKAQLYWLVRNVFRENLPRGVTDRATRTQLAAIRYGRTSSGKRRIEPKDKTKDRLGRSPDDAEALMLSFAPADLLREKEEPARPPAVWSS